MKIAGYIILGLAAFLITLMVPVALSGNLSMETLNRIIGREAADKKSEPATPVEEPDDIDPLVKALKAREEKVAQREAELAKEAARLDQDKAHVKELVGELEQILAQITQSLDTADANREKQIGEVAKSFASMKPKNAAQALETLPAEDAIAYLKYIKEKDRGKILDEMQPDKVAVLLQMLQERGY